MPKWEYNQIIRGSERLSGTDLNNYGKQGWELVSYNHILNSDHVYIFKRPQAE